MEAAPRADSGLFVGVDLKGADRTKGESAAIRPDFLAAPYRELNIALNTSDERSILVVISGLQARDETAGCRGNAGRGEARRHYRQRVACKRSRRK